METLHSGNLLEDLVNEPIQLPENPYWEVFKRFGRDEIIALFINAAGTGVAEYFLDNKVLEAIAGPVSKRSKDLIMAGTGPIIEKAGFFPAHFKEAWKEYRSTPRKERDGLTTYFRKAAAGGATSLIEDILVHDPLYFAMMYAGLNLWPETPAAILSVSSFVLAVVAVSAGEVGVKEMLFSNYKKSLRKAGFGAEAYYESRFLISKNEDPEYVMDKLIRTFHLGEPRTLSYHDRYFENHLPSYNGREPRLRLRERERRNGGISQSAQIVYRKTTELAKKKPGTYNYYPQLKEKMYFILDQPMPGHIRDVNDTKARRILERAERGETSYELNFRRTLANDPSTLFVSTDDVRGRNHRPFFVLELKTYMDQPELLKKAMKFVLREFSVVQTTYGKLDIAYSNGK